MEAGDIGHSQSTTLEVTLDYWMSGTISFYHKESTETGYDYFRFYIDGVEQGSWSGTDDWREHSSAVTAGLHTLTWTYSKDGSVDTALDTVWIDMITTTNGGL
jgi:hypothetical protein